MKDWTTHFELDAHGERVEVVTPLESVEEQQYRERRAVKRKVAKEKQPPFSVLFSADIRRGDMPVYGEITLEDCILSAERFAEHLFYKILKAGGAGSEEAVELHANWMITRAQRATMDAIDNSHRWEL